MLVRFQLGLPDLLKLAILAIFYGFILGGEEQKKPPTEKSVVGG